jgi:hypothetical protein
VKTTSHLCGSDQGRFVGSGILFRAAGGVFALTSEHVVLHGNLEICVEVANEVGNWKAELVRADWGRGLALLKILDEVREELPTLDDFRAPVAAADEMVSVLGFPFSLATRPKSEGKVFVPTSRRALIPLVPEVTEILGGHVEYGMRGGAVVATGTRAFVGLISHQALKPVAGKPSRVVDLSKEEASADDFFVIPAPTVSAWLGSLEVGPVSFMRDPVEQLEGKRDAVFTNGLRWEIEKGRPGTPVGGSGGVGIGGDGRGEGGSSGPVTRVVFSADGAGHKALWSEPTRQKWLDQVAKRVAGGEKIWVSFFLRYGSSRKEASRVSFASLAEFVSLLRNPELRPATYVEREGRDDMEVGKKLVMLGKEIVSDLNALEKSRDVQGSFDARRLLGQLHLLSDLLSASDWQAFDLAWVKGLAGSDYEAGWRVAFNADFDTTVGMMRAVLRSVSELERLRL